MPLREDIDYAILGCQRRLKKNALDIEHLVDQLRDVKGSLRRDALIEERGLVPPLSDQQRSELNAILAKLNADLEILRASDVASLRKRLQEETLSETEIEAIHAKIDKLLEWAVEPLRALIKTKQATPQQLAEALTALNADGWTPIKFLLWQEQTPRWPNVDYNYSEIVKILLDIIEDEILKPLENDPSNSQVQAAKAVIRDAFFYLRPSQTNRTLRDNLQALVVFFDYIFIRDQNKDPAQRCFTAAEISDYAEQVARQARKYPEILIELANHLYSQLMFYSGTQKEEKGQIVVLDKTSKAMLALLATCYVVANHPERFVMYGHLMKRTIDATAYSSLSEFITKGKRGFNISPEEFDLLMDSPLEASLERQLSTNFAAALELGELKLWQWRFAVQRNAPAEQVNLYLRQAITHLTNALYIDDTQFPSRALELLQEIHKELATAQRQLAELQKKKPKLAQTASEVKAEKKREVLSLEEDVEFELVAPVAKAPEQKTTEIQITPQLRAKAANAQQWLPVLQSFIPVVDVSAVLRKAIPTELKAEVERIRHELEQEHAARNQEAEAKRDAIVHQVEAGELDEEEAAPLLREIKIEPPLPPAKPLSDEELARIQQELQGQKAMEILAEAITAPQFRIPELPHAQGIAFRSLEYLAVSGAPKTAQAAKNKIIQLLREKFGSKQNPDEAKLAVDLEEQVPQLSALQSIQFLRNAPEVDTALEGETQFTLLDFFLRQYLQQQKTLAEQKEAEDKLEADPRQARTVEYALNDFLDMEIERRGVDAERSLELILDILRTKLRDRTRVAENLPDVPNRWLSTCFYYTQITSKLTPIEKFTFLNYFATQMRGGSLDPDALVRLLSDCRDQPGFHTLLFNLITSSADWWEGNRPSPSRTLHRYSPLKYFFDEDPSRTVSAYLPMLPYMERGYRSDQYYFAVFVLEALHKGTLTFQKLLSDLQDIKQTDILVQATIDVFHEEKDVPVPHDAIAANIGIRNRVILECVQQGKVSLDFAVNLLSNQDLKYESQLKQKIFESCLARYGEMSPTTRANLDRWVWAPDPDIHWLKTVYTNEQRQNLVRYWIMQAQYEPILGVIHGFMSRKNRPDLPKFKEILGNEIARLQSSPSSREAIALSAVTSAWYLCSTQPVPKNALEAIKNMFRSMVVLPSAQTPVELK